MNKLKLAEQVFQRVLEKMEQRGMTLGQPSASEAVHELVRYLDSDDRAYLNDRGQLVLESDGDTSTESNRRLAMAIRQLKHVAEGLGLALQPDLRPTAFRVPEAGLFCSVATFDFSLSGSVQEATEQELDSAARRAGFTKNQDGWVINERRAGGPFGLAYAFVIPEKNGLKWSVMDRIGGNVGNGFDAPNPGLFAKVKAMYDRGKNKPGDVPARTLASVQEFGVQLGYDDNPSDVAGFMKSLGWKVVHTGNTYVAGESGDLEMFVRLEGGKVNKIGVGRKGPGTFGKGKSDLQSVPTPNQARKLTESVGEAVSERPYRTLASVQEGVASSLPWKQSGYQREVKYKGYTFAIGEKKKKGIWVGVVKPSQPLIVDTIGYFPNEQAVMAAVDRYISSHEAVSERPFEGADWAEAHQREATLNQIGTGSGRVQARAREGMKWFQKSTAGGPGWLGKWEGTEIEVWVIEAGQTPTSNSRPYWSARGKTVATASGFWEPIGKFTTAGQAKDAAEAWAKRKAVIL